MDKSLVRVLVVDDFAPFRRFIFSTLQGRQQIQIICEASDGLEAVEQAEKLRPDLILLDIGLPTLSGIEAARQIRKLSPESKILFLSAECSTDMLQEVISLGAQGYVLKVQAQQELVAAMEAVIQGKRFFSSRLADNVKSMQKNLHAVELGRLGGKKGGPARAKKLSAEERRESARNAAQARWSKRRS